MSCPQCRATSKRTGRQCQKRARTGYPVCEVHGAGKGAKRGGRPPVHGYYSKFLRPEEVEDFEHFKQSFSLDEDLAFACVKAYSAVQSVDPEKRAALLEVPSKVALRRKQILEGTVLKLDLDVRFLQLFIEKVLLHVENPEARQELLAFVGEHLGEIDLG